MDYRADTADLEDNQWGWDSVPAAGPGVSTGQGWGPTKSKGLLQTGQRACERTPWCPEDLAPVCSRALQSLEGPTESRGPMPKLLCELGS